VIRDATATDCDRLSALAFASKAHWGYDEAFMEACRAELSVSVADLARASVRVAVGGDILGFHGVAGAELEWLFVAPHAMRSGVGTALFHDALEVAQAKGVRELRIDADPNAGPFYERMGARRVGNVPSASIPGRVLPVFAIGVSSTV
jgi:GNAT superfamily N-acetyltransferase